MKTDDRAFFLSAVFVKSPLEIRLVWIKYESELCQKRCSLFDYTFVVKYVHTPNNIISSLLNSGLNAALSVIFKGMSSLPRINVCNKIKHFGMEMVKYISNW